MPTEKLEPGHVYQIPVGDLQPDPDQPRKLDPKAQSLESLTASVRALGVRQPITVRYVPQLRGKKREQLFIVTGERRWRAAQAAGLETVPCILQGDEDDMTRAAVQLAENLAREGLSPMETAEFLHELQTRQHKSTNELVAELAKLGVQDVTRARVDKLLEFVKLPAWAKKMLREGQLTEAHAVHLLSPMRFANVMKELQADLKRELEWKGSLTVKDVQRAIEHAYRGAGRDLQAKPGTYVQHPRHFDLKLCNGCEFRVKIGGGDYCLKPDEFDKKNKAALDLQAQREAEKAKRAKKKGEDRDNPDPTKVTPRRVTYNDAGVVKLTGATFHLRKAIDEGGFDPSSCEGCPHKHRASHDGSADAARDYCFHLPCFAKKHREARRDVLKHDKLADYLDDWLRPRVLEQVAERAKPLQVQGLVYWLATGAITRAGSYSSGQHHEIAARETRIVLRDHYLPDFPRVYAFGMDPNAKKEREAAIAQAAVRVMDHEQLRFFAKEIGMTLEAEGYRIDEGYLALQKKADVIELARIGQLESARGSVAALKKQLLETPEAIERIGVPADLRALYNEAYAPAEADAFSEAPDWDGDPDAGDFGEPADLDVAPEDLAGALNG